MADYFPQIIWIALTFGGIVLNAVKHGKPKEGTYNAFIAVVTSLIVGGILYWGGFFG